MTGSLGELLVWLYPFETYSLFPTLGNLSLLQ